MDSQQHLQTISQLVHQLKEELQAHDEAVKAEAKALQFCDEYQQDLLHIIESFATSDAENEAIMDKLRQNRLRRRDIKDRQKVNLKFTSSIKKLQQIIHAFPTANVNTTPTYMLKTLEGLHLVDTLDAERTQVIFHYTERKNAVKKQKQQGVFSSECTDLICSSPTDTTIHLVRHKRCWKLIENDDSILFSHKKMQNVASYIIAEDLKVYADKLALNQLTKLVEDQLQLL